MRPMDFFEAYCGIPPRAGILQSERVCQLCSRSDVTIYKFRKNTCCSACDTVRRVHGGLPGRLSAGDLAIIKKSGSVYYSNQEERALTIPQLTNKATFVRGYKTKEVFQTFFSIEEDNMFIAFARSNEPLGYMINKVGTECALLSGDFEISAFSKTLVARLKQVRLDRKQWNSYLTDREKIYGAGSPEALTRRKKMEQDFRELAGLEFLPAADSAEAFMLGMMT